MNDGYMTNLPVYFISLDRSSERTREFLARLERFSRSIVHIQAVNGRNKSQVEASVQQSYGELFLNVPEERKKARPAVVGCTLSQLKAIRAAYLAGHDLALVMEDDMSLDLAPWWGMSLDDYVQTLPEGWQASQLSWLHPDKLSVASRDVPHLKTTAWGTGAYVIHRRGMEQVLALYSSRRKNDDRFDVSKLLKHCPTFTADDCMLGFSVGTFFRNWLNGSAPLPESYLASPPFFVQFVVGNFLSTVQGELPFQVRHMMCCNIHDAFFPFLRS